MLKDKSIAKICWNMLGHAWTSLDKLEKHQHASNILIFHTGRKCPNIMINKNNKVIFRP